MFFSFNPLCLCIQSSFEVALTFEHPGTSGECNFLCDLYPDQFRKHKNREVFTKIRVTQVLSTIDHSTFKSCYQCPPKKLDRPCDCVTIRCKHDAVYVAGRYNKYSRTLSQTPWIIDGSRKTESSIEELICTKIQCLFHADEYRFSASGREDVDVKMLGTGRPFVMDMTNPHRVTVSAEELQKLQKEINSSTSEIAVRDLQIVSREETNMLKEGEMLKTKSYSALCWAQTTITEEDLKKLESIKDLPVQQKTPVRVLHRRPQGVREKCVYKMSAELLDPHHFRLQLSTQAGTYIKEFVHGDFGRTRPSVGELLHTDCDILELNVEEIELDWPKKLDSPFLGSNQSTCYFSSTEVANHRSLTDHSWRPHRPQSEASHTTVRGLTDQLEASQTTVGGLKDHG
ncbi:putative tRNA pseudouridine synthase Pus10 [Lamellibrachia satsuma]|nr:putative tRNA pseudouridine synthase Pus10 [Lamellibrachia satsuma]